MFIPCYGMSDLVPLMADSSKILSILFGAVAGSCSLLIVAGIGLSGSLFLLLLEKENENIDFFGF